MTPKRILLDSRVLIRREASGIPVYTELLFSSLFRLHTPHEFILFGNSFRRGKPSFPLPLSERPPRIVNWGIPNKLLDLSSRLLHFPAVDRLTRADVVFSPHFNALSTATAPRVITFHDLSFLHHPYFFSWRQRFWHWLQDFKKQAMSARAIIALSEFTKHDIVELLRIPSEKIHVIHSGVDSRFHPLSRETRREFRARYNLQNPYILYLGTLEPRKNVPAIIRSFNILKEQPRYRDLKLILAGRPGWLYTTISREAARSPHHADIIFWGPVTPEDQIFLYNEARVFVYPSFFEGFGFPPLEAQACGTPIVVSDRTSMPEIVGEFATRVNPWDVEALGYAIESLIDDSEKRESTVVHGLRNASQFDWQKTAQMTLSLLEHVSERNF